MIDSLLKSELDPVARRHQKWRLRLEWALCWGVGAVLGIFLLLGSLRDWWSARLLFPLLALAVGLALYAVWRRGLRKRPDYRRLARQIEEQHPDLHALLLTAVEQGPDQKTGQYHFLQKRVIHEALEASHQAGWQKTVSNGKLAGSGLVNMAALGCFLAVCWMAVQQPGGTLGWLGGARGVIVTPGDVSVERGESVVVLARFNGEVPGEADLVVLPEGGNKQRLSLNKNLDDPVFGGTIPVVDSDLLYYVDYGGRRSGNFHIRVFDYPALQRADAELNYPKYTRLPSRTIKNTRRVSAVEGTELKYRSFSEQTGEFGTVAGGRQARGRLEASGRGRGDWERLPRGDDAEREHTV